MKPTGADWHKRTFKQKRCTRCRGWYLPVVGGQKRCTECKPVYQSRRLFWATQRRTCIACKARFIPNEKRHIYCTNGCRDRFLQRKYRAKTREPLLERPCPTCKTPFVPPTGNSLVCSPRCRPSVVELAGHGRTETFHIGDMTPSEYAFSRIMQDQGITVDFVGKRGRKLFPLNGTSYTPDFASPDRKTYIEVCGTRQAFHANKAKYAAFRVAYPTLTLKIVKPDGQEIQAP